MDAVTAAAMSDPERNVNFRRRWAEHASGQNPPALQAGTTVPLELVGRELLAAWRLTRPQPTDPRR